MYEPSGNPGSLEELAGLQLEKLRALFKVLENERLALVSSDAPDIVSLSEKKSALISELSKLEQQQSAYLTAPKELTEELTQAGKSLEMTLEEIRSISKECMKKNQLNGHLVTSAKTAVLAALEIVRNDPASQLYSNLGICDHEQGKKSLGTA